MVPRKRQTPTSEVRDLTSQNTPFDAIPKVVVRPVRPKLAPEARGRSAERNF